MAMNRKICVTILLLHYRLLYFGLPSYKADLDLRENFVTSVDASYSGDDGEILKGSDINSLCSDLDNRELEPLQRQFKQSKSSDSLEGKVNIPMSDKSYGMENRTQDSNLTWNDNFLNSIIHHQVLMMILLVFRFICIAAAICCWCRCLGRCCCSVCGPLTTQKMNE
jgi:hypothetical protein